MGKFNWWRREKKEKKLTQKEAFLGRSFLLQQIEHGDYNYSDYKRQADQELSMMSKDLSEIQNSHRGGWESLQDKLHSCERKYRKRYNKLMQDHLEEESRLLRDLKSKLYKEFGVDVWEEALGMDSDQTIVGLYNSYKIKANEVLQKNKLEADIDISR